MSCVVFNSAFNTQDRYVEQTPVGKTVREWLEESGHYERMTLMPIVIMRNGEELAEKYWDEVIAEDDVFALTPIPQGPAAAPFIAWLAANWVAVVAVASIALQLIMPEPKMPNGAVGTSTDSSSYSLNSRNNRARLGEPMPVLYGTMRVYPDLSAQPYSTFVAGEQVVYQLFEVTQGRATIDTASARFEDTLLSNFTDSAIEVIPPGSTSTIFPVEVYNSSEVSNITVETTHGNFSANAPGTQISRIECDFTSPTGIYHMKKDGKFESYTVYVNLFWRQINDSGTALTGWSSKTLRMVGSSTDKIQRTISADVTPGRYEVRVTRSPIPKNESRYGDVVVWNNLKAFSPESTVTDTTRIAVRCRATSTAGNLSLQKFNVIAKRQLRKWQDGAFTGLVETNNPAWAFIDACTAEYGGKRPNSDFDLSYIASLAPTFESEGIECNGIFDKPGNLWDALTNICQTCFCIPIDRAGVYTMAYDEFQDTPVQFYSPRNIVRDSFKVEHIGILEETADGVQIEFYDKEQDYRLTTLDCVLPGSDGANLRTIRMWGVTDKDQAQRIGYYLAAQNVYRRKRVTWTTGIEGQVPFFGDVVRVSHPMLVLSNRKSIAGDIISRENNVLTVNVNLDSDEFENPRIIIQGEDGEPSDILSCSVIASNKIQVSNASGLVTFKGDGYERPHFVIANTVEFSAYVKVTKIQSNGDDTVTVSGFVDSEEVYNAINGAPSPIPKTLPALKSLTPVVRNFAVFAAGSVAVPQYILTWDGENADRYDLEYSDDGQVTWNNVSSAHIYDTKFIHTTLGSADGVDRIYWRVAGVSAFRGAWSNVLTKNTTTDLRKPTAITNLVGTAKTSGDVGRRQNRIEFTWSETFPSYRIELWTTGTSAAMFKSYLTSTAEWTLTDTLARENDFPRTFELRFFGIALDGAESNYVTYSVANNRLAAPTVGAVNPVVSLNRANLDLRAYCNSNRFRGIRVWASDQNNFAVSAATLLVSETTDTTPTINLPWERTYVKVAILDTWKESDVTVSGQWIIDQTELATDVADVFGWDEIPESGATVGATQDQITAINSALAQLTDISADGKLDPSEKHFAVREHAVLVAEHQGMLDQGTNFGLTTLRSAYLSAYNALNTYLNGLSPAWNSTTTTTNITRATWNTRWTDVYVAKTKLLQGIADIAATTADWTKVTDASGELQRIRSGASGAFLNTIGNKDYELWAQIGGTIAKSTDAFSTPDSLLVQSTVTPTSANAGGTTAGGGQLRIPADIALSFSGRRLRISVMAKRPSANAANQFAVCFSNNKGGVSGWRTFTPTTAWAQYSFIYDAPNLTASSNAYVGICGDTAGTNRGILIDNVCIEVATKEGELNAYGLVNASGIRNDNLAPDNILSATGWTVLPESGATVGATAAQVASINALSASIQEFSTDGKLTPQEKYYVIREWAVIVADQPGLLTKCDEFGLAAEKTALTTAYNNVSGMLGSYSPAWNDTSKTTNINRTTWNSRWSAYYTALTNVYKAYSTYAAANADWAKITDTSGEMNRIRAGAAGALVNTVGGNDWAAWASTANGSVTKVTDSFSTPESAYVRSTSNTDSAANSGGSTGGGGRIQIPAELVVSFSGRRIRVSCFAKKPASNASPEFAFCYSTSYIGNSGWKKFAPTTSWIQFSFLYDVPSGTSNSPAYIGFWGDTGGLNRGILIDNVTIEVATAEGELNAYGLQNAAGIRNDNLSQSNIRDGAGWNTLPADGATKNQLAYDPVTGELRDLSTIIGTLESVLAATRRGERTIGGGFIEAFSQGDSINDWFRPVGAGEMHVSDDTGTVAGGKGLWMGNNSGNDLVWAVYKNKFPFDPSKTYRLECRVYNAGTNVGTFYAGLVGYDRLGTLCNGLGEASYSNQHYVLAGNSTAKGWKTFVTYIKGTAATASYSGAAGEPNAGGNNPINNPGKLHANVRYVAPMFIANYNGQTGVMIADYFRIDIIPDDVIDNKISILRPDNDYKNSNVTKGTVGLANVENKSSATIRAEITDADVTRYALRHSLNNIDANGHSVIDGRANGRIGALRPDSLYKNSALTAQDVKEVFVQQYIGGTGANLNHPAYTRFIGYTLPPFSWRRYCTTHLVGVSSPIGDTALQVLINDVTSNAYLDFRAKSGQITFHATAGKKYLFSCWLITNQAGAQVRIYGQSAGNPGDQGYIPPNSWITVTQGWARYVSVLTASATGAVFVRLQTNQLTLTTNNYILMDGLMVEEQIGTKTTPSELQQTGKNYIDPYTGQPFDQRGLPMVATTSASASSLSANDAGTTARINIAAHNVQFDFGQIAYNAGSITGLAFNTTYYVYCDDPGFAGGAITYVASTNALNSIAGTYRRYLGKIKTPVDGGAGSTEPDPWEDCIVSGMFLNEYFPVDNAYVGDYVDAWDDGRAQVFAHKIQKLKKSGGVESYRIETESGAALCCSKYTPITLQDGRSVYPYDSLDGYVGVVHSGSMDVVWEKIVKAEAIGPRNVYHISVGGISFAAGEDASHRIITHNRYKF